MAFVSASTSQVGDATKKEFYDEIVDNTKINKDSILGNNAEGTGATPHNHSGSPLGVNIPNLTNITTRNHSDLQNIGVNDHHNKNHKDSHVDGTDDIRIGTSGYSGLMGTNASGMLKNLRAEAGGYNNPTYNTWYPFGDPILGLGLYHIHFIVINGTTIGDFLTNYIEASNAGRIQHVLISSGNERACQANDGVNNVTFSFKIESGYLKIRKDTNLDNKSILCLVSSVADGNTGSI